MNEQAHERTLTADQGLDWVRKLGNVLGETENTIRCAQVINLLELEDGFLQKSIIYSPHKKLSDQERIQLLRQSLPKIWIPSAARLIGQHIRERLLVNDNYHLVFLEGEEDREAVNIGWQKTDFYHREIFAQEMNPVWEKLTEKQQLAAEVAYQDCLESFTALFCLVNGDSEMAREQFEGYPTPTLAVVLALIAGIKEKSSRTDRLTKTVFGLARLGDIVTTLQFVETAPKTENEAVNVLSLMALSLSTSVLYDQMFDLAFGNTLKEIYPDDNPDWFYLNPWNKLGAVHDLLRLNQRNIPQIFAWLNSIGFKSFGGLSPVLVEPAFKSLGTTILRQGVEASFGDGLPLSFFNNYLYALGDAGGRNGVDDLMKKLAYYDVAMRPNLFHLLHLKIEAEPEILKGLSGLMARAEDLIKMKVWVPDQRFPGVIADLASNIGLVNSRGYNINFAYYRLGEGFTDWQKVNIGKFSDLKKIGGRERVNEVLRQSFEANRFAGFFLNCFGSWEFRTDRMSRRDGYPAGVELAIFPQSLREQVDSSRQRYVGMRTGLPRFK